MTTLPRDHVVVELAPGGDLRDPTSWQWQDITDPAQFPISIQYGRRDEGSQVDPTVCQLTVKNNDGRFSPHNPLGPWYGLLKQNTPLRVRWGGRSEVIGTSQNLSASISAAAPSVSAPEANALLICNFAHRRPGGVTVSGTPSGMTSGGNTTGGSGGLYDAWQAVGAGATGTRTATYISTVDTSTNLSFVATGASATPVVQERIGGTFLSSAGQDVVTTAAAAAGWHVLIVQSMHSDEEWTGRLPSSPGELWEPVVDTGLVAGAARVRAWQRPVTTAGAQEVTFYHPGGTAPTHYRLYLISGLGQVRFTGFVSEWPTRWLGITDNSRVPITANGIMRRLSQGARPIRSALFRQIKGGATSGVTVLEPAQYWPLEDDSDARRASSAIDGRHMLLSDNARLGEADGPVGSISQATLDQNATLIGFVDDQRAGDASWMVEGFVDLGSATSPEPKLWLNLFVGGTYGRLSVRIEGTAVLVRGVNEETWAEATLLSHTPSAALTGVHHVAVSAHQSGANTSFKMWFDGGQVDTSVFAMSISNIRKIGIENVTAGTAALGVSHVVVWPTGVTGFIDQEAPRRAEAGAGYAGETPVSRVKRLCAEQGVPVAVDESLLNDGIPLGPQPAETFLAVLADVEATDGGVLYEYNGMLAYQPVAARYNQPVKLVLDMGDLDGMPEPTDDDQRIRNSVTASNSRSGSAAAEDAVSVAAVGRYESSVSVNPGAEEDLQNIASWLVHLGTADSPRWPVIPLELARHDALLTAWLAFRLGNRITIDHDFEQLPGLVIDLLGDGWSETFTKNRWNVALNCVPAAPYDVGELDDVVLGRLDTDGSELASAVDADDTSWSVAVTEGLLWTTTPAEFPFDVAINGEVVTVTAVSGASSPQTFTVVRGVNGITKAHGTGTLLSLAHPMVIGL